MKVLKRGSILLLAMTVITGILYPLLMTGLAQLLFPYQANGSLVYRGGEAVGSLLIGQNFHDPRYFHGRPSAAGENGYDAASSSGSNLGPTNQILLRRVTEEIKGLRAANGHADEEEVPSDLVTASGSGLDPDISPAAAFFQAPTVAKARNLPLDTVENMIRAHIKPRQFGILGEPRVNVLELNMALDQLK